MFGSIKRRGIENSIESELEERLCLSNSCCERFWIGLCEFGRINTTREDRNGDIEVVLLFPRIDPSGCVLPGGIGIESENHTLGKTAQQLHVVFSKRGSTGRNRSRHACFKEPDDIGIALADDCFIGLDDVGFCHVQPVEQLRLAVDRAIGRVLVLRSVDSRHDSATEPDRCSGDIVNREDNATAERVGWAIAAVDETQPGLNKDIVRNFEGTSKFVPTFRSPTDSECANVVAIESPRTEIPASCSGIGRGQQAIVIPHARFRYRVEQLCAPLTTFVLNFIGVTKRDPRLRRKFFNSAYKVEMLNLAHEGDDIALCATSEAVIELLLSINRE